MPDTETFREHIEKGYTFKSESILLGASVLEEKEEKAEPSTLERVINSTAGRTVIREVTRGLPGVLGLTGRRKATRRSTSGGLFDLFK